ncbi:MAG: dipeptide ABC transporter ATP-binding protein [Gammaproteobacteria bacterium]|nr:dipeptide ABC transporter ATP-binding protein [Gammaproteobacteria bacterium]
MAEHIIKAQNLSRYYQVSQGLMAEPRTLKALDGVSFSLDAGKTLAVVGESGCGKSTLGRLITLIEPPTGGNLWIHDSDISQAEKQQLSQVRKAVQIIFQDPYGSLNPRKKIGSILEEPLKINTSMTRAERMEKSYDLLEKVGLRKEHYTRYPHMFSGGQRQRIAIARALMLNPDIIVADEPTSALDVSIQAQVLNLMMELQETYNLAYLFISHGLSVVEHISDEVLVMYLGKTVEQGDKHQIFSQPQHPYTQALLASTPFVDPTKRRQRIVLKGELPSPLDPPSGCAFHRRCPKAELICSETTPELKPTANGVEVACHLV